MSGFGLGGFASGFLEGYGTMGRDMAQRGTLAVRQEQNRLEAERLRTAAESQHLQDGREQAESDARLRQAALTEQGMRIDLANKPVNADLEQRGKAAAVQGQEQQNSSYQQRLNADLAGTQAKTDQANAATAKTQLELNTEQQKQNQIQGFQQGIAAIKAGTATPDQVNGVLAFTRMAAAPGLLQHLNTLTQAGQSFLQTGRDDAFNAPETLDAANKTMLPLINQTVGMPLDANGRYVVGGNEITGFERDPETKNLKVKVAVQPVPTAAYRAQQEAILKDPNQPEEAKAAAQKALEPDPYASMLTDGRIPVAQGGQVRQFTPQDFQHLALGIKALGDLQATHPDLIPEMEKLNTQLSLGKVPAAMGGGDSDAQIKALDLQIKAAQNDRQNAREDQRLKLQEGDSATKRNEAAAKAMKEKMDEVGKLIDGQFMPDPQFSYKQLKPQDAQVGARQRSIADDVVKERPDWTAPQVFEEVKNRYGAGGAGSSGPGAAGGKTSGAKQAVDGVLGQGGPGGAAGKKPVSPAAQRFIDEAL